MSISTKLLTGSVVLLGLAGCSSGAPTPLVALTDKNSDATSPLSVQGVSTSGTSRSSGTLNRQAGTITLDGEVYAINPSGTSASGSSGEISIRSGNTDYVASYVNGSTFGVYGTPTRSNDLPTSGSASYTGDSDVVIIDQGGVYDLMGDATINVSFRNDSASATIDNLDGTLSTGLKSPTDLNDVGTIMLSDLRINGSELQGGNVSLDSDTILTALSGSEVSSVQGQFYGPDASEVGGSFQLDDSELGDLQVSGSFTGN